MYYNADFEKIYETKEEFKAALDEVVELYRQNSFLDKKDKKPKQDIKKNKVENPIIYPNNEMKTELDNFLRLYERVCFDKGKEAGKIETLILLLEQRFGSLSKKQKELIFQFNEKNFTEALKRVFSVKSVDEIFKGL